MRVPLALAATWHRRSPWCDGRGPPAPVQDYRIGDEYHRLQVSRLLGGASQIRHNALRLRRSRDQRPTAHISARAGYPARHCPHRSSPGNPDVTDSIEHLPHQREQRGCRQQEQAGRGVVGGLGSGRMDSTKFKELAFVRRPSDPGRPGPAVCPARPGALGSAWFATCRRRWSALVGAAGWDEGCGAAGAGAGSAGSVGVERPVVAARGAPGSSPGAWDRCGATEGPVGAASGCGGPAAARPGSAASARSRTRQAGARRWRGYWGRRRP